MQFSSCNHITSQSTNNKQQPQFETLTMKLPLVDANVATLTILLSLVVSPTCAFVGPQTPKNAATTASVTKSSRLYADTTVEASSSNSEPSPLASVKTKTLGLVTFDLDDTLYPIAPVIQEANAAFAKAMAQYGFPNIEPEEIDLIGKKIREEVSQTQGPEAASIITHTEIRTMAIRREMEEVIYERKLDAAAEDWATPTSSLSNIVRLHARKWVRKFAN
jgi:hypothetical protein